MEHDSQPEVGHVVDAHDPAATDSLRQRVLRLATGHEAAREILGSTLFWDKLELALKFVLGDNYLDRELRDDVCQEACLRILRSSFDSDVNPYTDHGEEVFGGWLYKTICLWNVRYAFFDLLPRLFGRDDGQPQADAGHAGEKCQGRDQELPADSPAHSNHLEAAMSSA